MPIVICAGLTNVHRPKAVVIQNIDSSLLSEVHFRIGLTGRKAFEVTGNFRPAPKYVFSSPEQSVIVY